MKLVTFSVIVKCLLVVGTIIHAQSSYDLTVVGQIKLAASLPRLSLGIINCLKDEGLKINFIATHGDYDLTDIPYDVQQIVTDTDKTPGKVALFVDMLWSVYDTPTRYVPSSTIKIAYSMLEGTAIPKQWVDILNKQFDAVVVPDTFYQQVYSTSGVTIPVFVIPCGFYLEEFFEYPLKSVIHKPFVFGMTAAFAARKNYELLLEAFACEFGNNPDVMLKLHGRGGDNYFLIKDIIKSHKLKNVKLINKVLSRLDYLKFMVSLDCYVLLSKGEGFSLTPREALALGIPCILSNNTAQKTICATGFVYTVPSDIKEPAYYKCFGGCCGNNFNCTLADARKALREVYRDYYNYLHKAHRARKWVKKYLYENLKELYLALVKPYKVVLAEENGIEGVVIKTNSKKLYEKYMSIM
jgi:glycosyltransferase involved in cell wall biosynthesis